MADEVVEKTPTEIISQTVDFTDLLPLDATIGTSAATAVDSSGTAATILGAVTDAGMIVSFKINATVDNEDYLITVTAPGVTSSDTRTWIIEVRSRSKLRGVL